MLKYDTLLDVGTGAGFPALVLAIAQPQYKSTSTVIAKNPFLRQMVVAELALKNVRCIMHGLSKQI